MSCAWCVLAGSLTGLKGDLVGGLVAFCGWAGVWVLASKWG